MSGGIQHTVEEIGAKIDALGRWKAVVPYNFAVRPRGTVLPYFCTTLLGDGKPVRVRFLMLEGWQTLHDFVRTRLDRDFGFCTVPMELPHFEMVILADGSIHLFRHDPGYMPAEANATQRAFVARILWEAYGLFLRMESDPKLMLKYAEEKAVFARVEREPGVWADEPLVIPDARPHVEKVSFPLEDVKKSQDLPQVTEFVLELDFRMMPGLMTKEARPRCVYGLRAVDATTGERLIDCSTSVAPDAGLRGIWESMPPQVLRELIRLGRIPGEIRVVSGRVFRLLRPMCMKLPFKLSIHDSLEKLEATFR